MKRIPNCAHCGKTLKNKARTILEFKGIPGKPWLGWHDAESGSCFDDDPIREHFTNRESRTRRVEDLLMEVSTRGPGRVIAGKAWHKRLN